MSASPPISRPNLIPGTANPMISLLELEYGPFMAKMLLVQAGIAAGDDEHDQYEITKFTITVEKTIIVNRGIEYHLVTMEKKA